MKQYDVIRFVHMMSLGSIAALNCRNSQSIGRYRACGFIPRWKVIFWIELLCEQIIMQNLKFYVRMESTHFTMYSVLSSSFLLYFFFCRLSRSLCLLFLMQKETQEWSEPFPFSNDCIPTDTVQCLTKAIVCELIYL